jgi:hypothetical protein
LRGWSFSVDVRLQPFPKVRIFVTKNYVPLPDMQHPFSEF